MAVQPAAIDEVVVPGAGVVRESGSSEARRDGHRCSRGRVTGRREQVRRRRVEDEQVPERESEIGDRPELKAELARSPREPGERGRFGCPGIRQRLAVEEVREGDRPEDEGDRGQEGGQVPACLPAQEEGGEQSVDERDPSRRGAAVRASGRAGRRGRGQQAAVPISEVEIPPSAAVPSRSWKAIPVPR